ncbi:hypothetical protein JK361_05795 [Streptomyces sp. 5-8]|uniref:Uncharacterized protein n=1 Tax=Streptomyces musisoli TaxID=2802280 RepID=A0ABS1NWC1_9ACTN|nr:MULTISPECIES: hypothetical protein [Streptomyces]MBL1104122.1 hypothetical protein [Streptomyces musisoli]MBY8840195.1 hypothetical protein [Streptomyces sp. SP2-10]
MATSTPEESRSSDDVCTPDALLHSAPPRVTPEDLVMAAGRDVTPKTLEWARRKLESEGSAAIEKLLP